jgi:hypothetical protein
MDFVATNNNSTTTKHPHGEKRTKEVEKTNKINGSAMCIQAHATQEMVSTTFLKAMIFENASIMALFMLLNYQLVS